MKTYLLYKNEIQGFGDVAETVKTIEKIAASSIHFLKQRVAGLDRYAKEVNQVLTELSLFYQTDDNPLLKKKKTTKKAIVILTGDKGLVGGLWYQMINQYLENQNQYSAVIVIGQKGKNYLAEGNIQIVKSFPGFSDIVPEIEIEKVIDYLFEEFQKGLFAKVDILYPHFISLGEEQPLFVSFLPFAFSLSEIRLPSEAKGWPIFEPSKRVIFDWFLQKYIEIFFQKIVMETKLSEFSARTVAMEDAHLKTDKLIQKLIINFHKERRRTLTQKQLESFAVSKIF